LAITAITGTAASLVSGQTFDSLTGANRKKAKIGADILIDYQEVTINVSGERFKLGRFVNCDEYSMVGHYHLNLLDEALKKSRGSNLQQPFAGVNVFFFGDAFQFPPIGDRALYKQPDSPVVKLKPTDKELGNMRGYKLWHKQLTHVIRLRRQYRVEVRDYADFLIRLRYGRCTEEDVDMLNSRVLPSNPELIRELQDSDLPLITSRNAVRTNVSYRYLKNWTTAQGQPLVVSVARDKIKGTPTEAMRRRMLMSTKKGTDKAPGFVPLVLNTQYILKSNISVPFGLCNGSQGYLVDILFDGDDGDKLVRTNADPQVAALQRMPSAVIMYFPDCTIDDPLPGLPPKHVSIKPLAQTFSMGDRSAKQDVLRFQLPIVPAKVMTSYCVQGRTLSDGAAFDPELPRHNSAEMYVALSRVTCLNKLYLLRPVNLDMLTRPPDEQLLAWDAKLEQAILAKLRHQLFLP